MQQTRVYDGEASHRRLHLRSGLGDPLLALGRRLGQRTRQRACHLDDLLQHGLGLATERCRHVLDDRSCLVGRDGLCNTPRLKVP